MYSLQQAFNASPVLSEIAQRVRLSQQLLEVVRPHIPLGLRSQVVAGPVEDDAWCLFVSNPAVATKLKQLTPALLAAMRTKGHAITKLRIKVQMRP